MIKQYKAVLFFGFLITVCCPSLSDAMGWMDSPARKLYKKSGLKTQIHDLPGIIEQGFDHAVVNNAQLQRLPADTRNKIRSHIAELFTPASMETVVVQAIGDGLTDAEIMHVLAWLESPLGRKITEMEEAAGNAGAIQEMQQYVKDLEKNPPPAKWLSLLQKLDRVVGATETSVTVNINTQFAITTAMISALKPGATPNFPVIRRLLEKQRPSIARVMRPQILSSFLYTYRDLTSEELQAYIDFATTEIGKKYHRVIIGGVEKALVQCSSKWGREIGEIVRAE
ncbi:MAG: DUF2059 domain-containing protein [Thermodesulfobacteriota bacterium]|nr:DUF2059 domain-containing protein [Thermodesulfobacteriota bacterium]